MLPTGLLKEYWQMLSVLMRIVDTFAILFAAWLAFVVRFDTPNMPFAYLTVLLVASIAAPIIFSMLNIYTSKRSESFTKHILNLSQAIFVLALLLSGLAFYTKSGEVFSRTWFSLWMLFAWGLLVIGRCSLLLFLRFMRSRGLNERRVVILGANELGIKLANAVQQALWTGFRVVAFLDDETADKPDVIRNIPVLATPQNLTQYLHDASIDEFWLALPLDKQKRVQDVLRNIRHHTINTRLVLDIFGLDLLNHSMTDVAGFPVLNISSTPMIGINRIVKAIEDRLLALMILILISPILMLVSFAVKISSSGPILFKQRRLGWDGRVINVYKFRTMYVHNEEDGHVTQATINDKRVTPVGKWLRRFSIDELPQFINVLQGKMSIVGPRPHALAHNEFYKEAIDTYMQRHRVKPGITGWAQINGWRGETDTLNKMQKRVEYDLYYINNWSLTFDLKIILLTLFSGFINRNAY